ncbi:serine/threonine protein kinase [bacterium]|nr:serine/threonine protein kinase [bacterium]
MIPKTTADFEEKYIGSTINDRYKIIKLVGTGGMGSVYLAEHEILRKKVALKILHYEQSKRKDTVERFKREAIAASNIGQDNIVDVTDFGYTEEGNAYFVMEYIEGCSLADVMKEQRVLPLEFAVSVASQIAVALYAAHGKGIIHRDLKPENILLMTKDGIYPFVKIVDFGISKILQDDAKPDERLRTLTKSGAIFGTPEYMSPEQAAGESVEPASDIYSLGVIMYEMLTGKLPFFDDNYMKILHKHQYEFPELPSSVNPGIKPEMNNLIMKCLEKKPFNRYGTMMLLLNDLKNIYFKYNLEEKLSLAFLFNSGTVRSINPAEETISSQDIIRMLNSSPDEKVEHISTEKESKGAGIALKVIIVAALVAIAGFLVYGFVKKQNQPMVAERTELSKYDSQKNEETGTENENSGKKSAEQPKRAVSNSRKSVPMVKITINSNIPGVRIFNKENGRTICKAPCSRKFPKKEDGTIVLGFEYEDYSIEPMTVTLDKDMIVNLNLKQETENE